MNPLTVHSDPEHADNITVDVKRTGEPIPDRRHAALPQLANTFSHTRLPGIERMWSS